MLKFLPGFRRERLFKYRYAGPGCDRSTDRPVLKGKGKHGIDPGRALADRHGRL